MMAHELFEKLGYLRELDDDYIVYVERGNPWNYFKFVNKCASNALVKDILANCEVIQ